MCGICGTSAMHMCGISAVVRTLTASLYQSSTRGVTSGVQTVSTPCVTYPCSTRGVTRGVQTVSTPSVPPPSDPRSRLTETACQKNITSGASKHPGSWVATPPPTPRWRWHPVRCACSVDGRGTVCAVRCTADRVVLASHQRRRQHQNGHQNQRHLGMIQCLKSQSHRLLLWQMGLRRGLVLLLILPGGARRVDGPGTTQTPSQTRFLASTCPSTRQLASRARTTSRWQALTGTLSRITSRIRRRKTCT